MDAGTVEALNRSQERLRLIELKVRACKRVLWVAAILAAVAVLSNTLN